MISLRKGTVGVVIVIVAVAAAVLFASASALGACPNEAIRGVLHSEQLPDCRAYEMVSPTQKFGWEVELQSADESRAMIVSLGAFLGSNQALLNSYLVERTSTGWVTKPFANTRPLAVSAGLSEGVFEGLSGGLFEGLLPPGASEYEAAYYLEDLPSGSPVEIGPVFPPPIRHAAQREPFVFEPDVVDGHSLFEIEGPGVRTGVDALWPGDSTVTNGGGRALGVMSLYEYDGVGGVEPKLVGVRNKGALRTDQEAQLLGQCGVVLGSPPGGKLTVAQSVDAYNEVAASGDGWRVFFTVGGMNSKNGGCGDSESGAGTGPAVNELYARENGSETIAVSAPSREDCTACRASALQPAVFQGASEDGSRVFFLSSQELLEGAHGTNLYEFDFDTAKEGRALTLVGSEVLGVARVAQSGSHVYFVSSARLTERTNEYGAPAVQGEPNLYVYDTEDARLAFIGTLSASDSEDWKLEDERPVDASWDGRFLVFQSASDLTPEDSSTVAQVFEYDAETGTLTRVSAGENEFNDDGNTETYPARIVVPFYRYHEEQRPVLTSVSESGSVVFESSDALTGQAVLGYPNVYEYSAGQVSLISDGQDRSYITPVEKGRPEASVHLMGEDPSGVDIFFTTADQLVPQDGDTQIDIYDARVDGGFAAPPPPSCEGEGCQGALAAAPAFGVPQSVFEPAAANTTSTQAAQAPAKTKAKTKGKKAGKGKRAKVRKAKGKAGGLRGRSRGVSRSVRGRSSRKGSGR